MTKSRIRKAMVFVVDLAVAASLKAKPVTFLLWRTVVVQMSGAPLAALGFDL